ncbi:MAG: hypothetical protein E6I02_07945 [Chloroflexi bacterium]|nr:MAG: hypothetical protein E6I02_07945 [Chloroflexota bacterium]
MTARRLLLALCATLALAAACGGDGNDNPTQSPTAAPARTSDTAGLEPIDVVRVTLDDINRGDIDAAYPNFSAQARKDVSLDEARRLLQGLQASGTKLSVTIAQVGQQTITGDTAEIELTLEIELNTTKIPVDDAAILVREEGQWKIADHFLQTALAVLGLASPAPLGPRALDDKGCATGDPMEGVYAPKRLQILDPCLTVTGTVRDDINKAEDGDITFGLYLSEADQRLINDVNRANYDSALHIEIVPEDQRLVPAPKAGDKIRVTGPWVTDLAHGHNEIHPAFKIEKID